MLEMTVITRKLANSQRPKSEPEIPTICYVYPNGEIIVTRVMQRCRVKAEPEQQEAASAAAVPSPVAMLEPGSQAEVLPSDVLQTTVIQPVSVDPEGEMPKVASLSLMKRPCLELEPSYREVTMATVIQQLSNEEKCCSAESVTVAPIARCSKKTEPLPTLPETSRVEKTWNKRAEKIAEAALPSKSKNSSVFALDEKATFLLMVD
jgi:hypothetical protein